MDALYAIVSLLLVVALIAGSLKIYSKRNPNATAEDAGSLIALELLVVFMACMMVIGIQEDAARMCQQHPSPSCPASSK